MSESDGGGDVDGSVAEAREDDAPMADPAGEVDASASGSGGESDPSASDTVGGVDASALGTGGESDASASGTGGESDASASSTAGEVDSSQRGSAGEGPTPQSVALRRQQRAVGVAGSLLAGIALAVAVYQRFPDTSVAVPIFAGLLGTGVVLWLVRKSIFPGEGELATAD